MRNKWLWLAIGVVTAGVFVMAMVARHPEPRSEGAASLEQAPAPPLTFRERKERGLLTPEEQRIADEIAKMQEANKEYEKQRQARIAREEAEKVVARERQSEWQEYVAKRSKPTHEAGYWDMVDGIVRQMNAKRERDEIVKRRYERGLPISGELPPGVR